MGHQEVRVVLCTCPADAAPVIARRLVQDHLVACVNVVEGLKSVYWWDGEVQEDPESLLVIKTAEDRYAELEKRLCAIHPYDVPEVLALAVDRGSEAYLSWVFDSTRGNERE